MNANLESMIPRELPAEMQQGIVLPGDQESNWENTPRAILRSTLTALSEGRISDAVAQFDDCFKFNDHALALEFTDKSHLTEFFQKAPELFPDTALEVGSLIESGDRAIAEWKLAATQTLRYGSISKRIRIHSHGSTIARVTNAGIVQWADYYDHVSSQLLLGAWFTEWTQY